MTGSTEGSRTGYVEGFVAAVPSSAKDAYAAHAAEAARLLRSEFGVTRLVECWGDAVPDGERTDFRRAVAATADETIVFAWFEYPSRAARDAANERLRSDPRMAAMASTMPFDGRRMIFGGFAPFVDASAGGEGAYVDGFIVPVPVGGQAAYRALAERAAGVFLAHGATRVVEAWGDDVPDGERTDFRRAVAATADEAIVFSWIEWPSKAAHDRGMEAAMADPRMAMDPAALPFDASRMVWGGFATLLDR